MIVQSDEVLCTLFPCKLLLISYYFGTLHISSRDLRELGWLQKATPMPITTVFDMVIGSAADLATIQT